MTTHQSGVILLIICSGLALIWSAQSQLTHSSDSCGDIICPGSHVLYTCTFPIRGSVIVVWRMKPECELNIRDIIFIRGTDNQLNTMCDDRRTIEVQGMDTPNGTVFVSTLNVTNITSSQTVECIFDDGSTEESIGNSTVFTTAPAQGAEITAVTPNVVLTLNQAINCPLIEYAVNSSTNCGMCGIVIDDTITCNNALMGSKCTVVVETKLCGIPVNQTVMTFDVTQRPITLSTTPASTQEGSLSGDEITIAVVVPTIVILLAAAVIIAVIAIRVFAYKRMVKTYKSAVQETIQEQDEAEGRAEKVEMKPLLNSEAHNNQPGTEAGDNRQQNNGQGDLVQNNEGESKHQNNHERDFGHQNNHDEGSGHQHNDEGDSGHQHDDERDSGHQYKDERDDVEQVNKDEGKGNQNSDEGGDTDQPVDKTGTDCRSENPSITKIAIEESEVNSAQDLDGMPHKMQIQPSFEGQHKVNPNRVEEVVDEFQSQSSIIPRHKMMQDTYLNNVPSSATRSDIKLFPAIPPERNDPIQQATDDRCSKLRHIDPSLSAVLASLEELKVGQTNLKNELTAEITIKLKGEMNDMIEELRTDIKSRDEKIQHLEEKIEVMMSERTAKKEKHMDEIKSLRKEHMDEIKSLRKEKKYYMEKLKEKLEQNDPEVELCKEVAKLQQELHEEGTTSEVCQKKEAEMKQLSEILAKFQEERAAEIKKINEGLELMKREDEEI